MHLFIQNAHIVWQSSFRKQSLASPRSSRKSAGRSGRSIPSAVISPASDSCWVSPFLDYPFIMQKISQTEFEISDKQCQSFATLVPDVIICCSNLLRKDVESFVGVVLFADIAGFTSFCEEHEELRLKRGHESVHASVSKLTATLNGHLGAMVQLVCSSGGDVIKFSGDAILALWKVYCNQFIYQVIHQVVSCALLIQRKLSDQEDLKVKLTISAGNMSFGVIGTERSRHYVLVGTPIQDLKKADGMCESGEVILSPSAWNHCSAHNYHHEMCEENHVKSLMYDTFLRFASIIRGRRRKAKYPIVQSADTLSGISNSTQDLRETDHFKGKPFRQSMGGSLNTDLASSLKPFMIPPVIQQIEANQPLEYLTEMRQVTTMFINLIPSDVMDDRQLIKLVDDVYCTVSRLVARALGCLTKVSLFDKDVMLLAVFGLRGFKSEQESRRSLRCGCDVKQAVSQIPGVELVSVGITTGMAYCGVVGHALRREYTVIGSHVNKAARIMCAYPGRVTCERTTLLQSNMPDHFFRLQEHKPMKGIEDVGRVYEYSEDIGYCASRASNQEVCHLPLLGREELMGGIECLLRAIGEREPYRQVQAVVLQGEAGVGKTRVLLELAQRAELRGFHTATVTLQPRHGTAPYSALQYISQQIMDANSLSTDQLVTQLIEKNPTSLSEEDVFLLKQSLSPNPVDRGNALQLRQEQKRDRLPSLVFSLMQLVYFPTVMILDDLHLMDDHSWQLCADILELQNVQSVQKVPTLVLGTYSLRDSCIPRATQNLIFAHPAVLLRTLPALHAELLAPLACQLLKADAIQRDIVKILDVHGRGNPGWCANYLDAVMQSEGLQVAPMILNAMQDFIVPHAELLGFAAESQSQSGLRSDESESMSTGTGLCYGYQENVVRSSDIAVGEVKKYVAVVINNRQDCEDKAALHVNDVIVSSFDNLPPYEQLVLKCASVVAYTLGGLFTRAMLLYLLHSVHEGSEEKTAKSIKHLFDMGVLGCANSDHTEESRCSCYADNKEAGVSSPQLPSYAFCKLLCFQTAAFQRAIYELLPGNQKRSFHLLAIAHLEDSLEGPLLCQACEFPEASSLGGPRAPLAAASGMGCSERQTNNSCKKWYDHLFKTPKTDVNNLAISIRVKDCYCPRLIVDTLSQLIDHCIAAGLKKKQLHYMADYGFTSILSGNPLEAIVMLSETEGLLRGMLLHDHDSTNRNKRKLHEKSSSIALLGRVLTLTGKAQACLSMGAVEQAEQHLSQALLILQINWPRRHFALQWMRCGCYAEQRLQQAACLALLSDLYSATGEYNASRDAAVASLCLALVSRNASENMEQVNLYLCAALSCSLESSVLCGDLKPTARIERLALQCVQRYLLKQFVNYSLAGRFFARLLCAVFVRRLFQGELQAALDAGVVVLRTSEQLCAWRAYVSILPLLIRTYIMQGRLNEALTNLQLLKDVSERYIEIDDEFTRKGSFTNYHILCLDVLLDVSEPGNPDAQNKIIEEASNFAQFLLETQQYDTLAQSIIVRLCLWFARKNDRSGSAWECLLGQATQKLTDWAALRYLEVLLVAHAYQQQLPLPKKSLITRLQDDAKTIPMLLPRFFHLRAYYTMLRRSPIHLPLSLYYLATATHLASKQENHLEVEWCQHSRKVWTERHSGRGNRTYSFLVPDNRIVV